MTNEQERVKLLDWELKHQNEGLLPLDERQRKLAQIDLNIQDRSKDCLTIRSTISNMMFGAKELRSLDKLFNGGSKGMSKDEAVSEDNFTSFVSGHVSTSDQYALMAQTNLKILKDKMLSLQQ